MLIKSRLVGTLLNRISKIIFHLIIIGTKLLSIPEEKLVKLFIRANNYLTYHRLFNLKANQVLMLLPHCLQNSDCQQKITRDIKNCKACGKCQICQLVEMSQQYPAIFRVVDGGEMARQRLKEGKYKAVAAVACERELESGILYSNLPVIAIINERPKGPCFETQVALPQVERALQFFLGGSTKQRKEPLKEAKVC